MAACACRHLFRQQATGKNFNSFSDDLDKALATFVLANGAAATGQKVSSSSPSGIECLEEDAVPDGERYFRKMFGMMLPVQPIETETVQDEYDGNGQPMMRFLMKRKG